MIEICRLKLEVFSAVIYVKVFHYQHIPEKFVLAKM
jgi:hypothetical protein